MVNHTLLSKKKILNEKTCGIKEAPSSFTNNLKHKIGKKTIFYLYFLTIPNYQNAKVMALSQKGYAA